MTFDHLKTIYRGYDIRGAYGTEITDEEVYKIGRALVLHFNANTIAVGRDIRSSSPALYSKIIKGITDQGATVLDLGITATPMVYFASGHLDVDLAVMITASHMTKEFNGLKICTKNAGPVAIDSGLLDIKELVEKNNFTEAVSKGEIIDTDIKPDYFKKIHSLTNKTDAKLKIVVDYANMMGILEKPSLEMLGDNIEYVHLFDDLDEDVPNHEANPIKPETLEQLSERVLEEKADLGIAFDGDGDRLGFVDEKGRVVRADLAGGIIASAILDRIPSVAIGYDLRSTKAVQELIERKGGTPLETRVGHSFIKQDMKRADAYVGFEVSGHFYFRDTNNAEAGPLPVFLIIEEMFRTGKTFSQLVDGVNIYAHSGEINSTVTMTPDEIYKELKDAFPGGEVSEKDGLKIVFKDWWFNARPSANDPVMRLNLEADTEELMEEKRDTVLDIIRGTKCES